MQQTERPGRYHFGADLVVEAPAEKVWDVLADFSAVDTWVPLVKSSHIKGDKDRGVGVRRHCTVKGFGDIDEIVTDWDEGRSLSYRVSSLGPFSFTQNTWTVDRVDEGSCRVSLELDYDVRFGAFGRLLHGLVIGRKLKQRAPNAIGLLKTRVETGETIRARRSPANEPQRAPAAA